MSRHSVQLVPLGLEIGKNDIRQRIGFDEPEKGDEVLRPAAAASATPPDEQTDKTDPKKARAGVPLSPRYPIARPN